MSFCCRTASSFLSGGKGKFEFFMIKYNRDGLAYLGRWVAEAKVKPVIEEVYEFEDVCDSEGGEEQWETVDSCWQKVTLTVMPGVDSRCLSVPSMWFLGHRQLCWGRTKCNFKCSRAAGGAVELLLG